MPTAAQSYDRVRKQLREHGGSILLARALGVLDALACLLLLLVLGLLLALVVTRGLTHVEPGATVPQWIQGMLTGPSDRHYWVRDTGLTPPIVENREPGSSWRHRIFSRGLEGVVRALPSLRSNQGALTTLVVLAFLLLLALLGLSQWRRRLAVRVAVAGATGLRRQIHRQMYRLGQSALPSQGIGPVLNLFTREVNDVRDALAADLDRSPRLAVLIVGSLLVALVISPAMTLFLIALLGMGFLLVRPLIQGARAQADAAARDAAVNLCLLHEDLGLVRTVRVYGMEGVDNKRFDAHLSRYEEADARRMRSEGAISPTLRLLILAGAAVAVAVLGAVVVARDSERISLAAVAAVVAALAGIVHLAPEWLGLRREIGVADRSAATIFGYLDRAPELTMEVGARFLPPLRQRITFENVGLTDGDGRALLTGVSAELPAGTKTSIVGLDQTSKLALVCLVPRLIDPTQGRVRIDGIDLRDVTLESLRAQVATVLQADLLFSDSVMANIGLGDPSFTLSRVIQAAKLAHAHHFIRDLPDGYDTLVGPVGHYLKPDEQYRIALARAFLHDPSVLIVEEPSGPIREEIRPLVDDALAQVARKRTVIYLPRRFSTVKSSDLVIVLHNGRIEALGPPKQLARESALFRQIQAVQFVRMSAGEPQAEAVGG